MDAIDFETQALEALPFDDVLLPDCPHGLAGTPEVTSSSACPRFSPQRHHCAVSETLTRSFCCYRPLPVPPRLCSLVTYRTISSPFISLLARYCEGQWRSQGGRRGATAPSKGLIRNFFGLYTFYIDDIIASCDIVDVTLV